MPADDTTRYDLLVYDEHPLSLGVLERRLLELGHRPILASNPDAALRVFHERPVFMALLDCRPAATDGLDLTRLIRGAQESTGARTLIVALTAFGWIYTRERCLAAGMDDHLVKPVSGPQIADLLRLWAPGLAAEATLETDALADAGFSADERDELLQMALDRARAFLARASPAATPEFFQFAAAEAHAIKGSAGMVGAGRLSQSAVSLMQLARAHDLAGVHVSLAALHDEVERLAARLR